MAVFKYRQLEEWLQQQIEKGAIPVGGRVPSIRQLCASQNVSKATAIHALRRLEARGLIVSHPKSGNVVTDVARPIQREADQALQAPVTARSPDLLLDVMARRGAFDLQPSAAMQATTPELTTLHRIIARTLRRKGMSLHRYYDEPAGLEALREQIALWYGSRGCPVLPENICITSGCQHSIYLALRVCCQAGDIVAVESPGFYGSIQCLEELGIKAIEIPSSPVSGMDVEALQRALNTWRIAACITTPNFATPTGASMPKTHREKLVELATLHDFVVIEDDVYGDTSFGESPATLKETAANAPVILCGSFSKSLSRDLRLGWILAGRWQQRIEKQKLVTLLAGNRGIQLAVTEFMADGVYKSHLRRLTRNLQQQRDQLLSELSTWGPDVAYSQPAGGLSLWVQLPDDRDTTRCYDELAKAGVIIVPGTLFSVAGKYHNCLRLGFENPWTTPRVQALQTLRQVLGF